MTLKNSKAKGNRQEYRTMRLLEATGYRCTRSAASLGEWDIVAVGPTDFVLVQVRSNRMPGPAERETLRNFVAPPNTKKLIHVWHDRKALPQIMEL